MTSIDMAYSRWYQFFNLLRASAAASWFWAYYLCEWRGWEASKSPTRMRKFGSKTVYTDTGDVIGRKWKPAPIVRRWEVKNVNKKFTDASDYPEPYFLVEGVDTHQGRLLQIPSPDRYVIIDDDWLHAGIVHIQTQPHWELMSKEYHKDFPGLTKDVYICPLEFVKWLKIPHGPPPMEIVASL